MQNWTPTNRTFRSGKVTVDLAEGMGSVPDCGNVEYLGFVVMMSPAAFLSIVPPRKMQSAPAIRAKADAGEAIGAPFLVVDIEREGDPSVHGHEGRNRMSVIAELAGADAEIPVCVFLRDGGRARHVNDEMIERFRAGALPERGIDGTVPPYVEGPLFGRAFLSGRVLDPSAALVCKVG